MNILEVRNNLLKLSYEEDLKLGEFIIVKDEQKSYIAQILHIEAGRIGKVALAKLLFITDSRQIFDYDGSIPSVRAEVEFISSDILLNNFNINTPILIGNLALNNEEIIVDNSFLSEKLLICSDSNENDNILINNICNQLKSKNKKALVLKDFDEWTDSDLTACENFKIPLNADAIDFICEYGLADANAEGKAIITEIFNEIREYAKTVPFIPFDAFQNVVNDQYSKTKMLQLVLLNSKLRKYGEQGIFARTQDEFEILGKRIRENNILKLDLSNLADVFKKEYYTYILSEVTKSVEPIYTIIKLNNDNSDKKLLKRLLFTDNIKPIIITSYNYKYLSELKQHVSNMMLLSPSQQQSDFTSYNVFLNKLLSNEFLAYGKATNNVPFIVKIEEVTKTVDGNSIPKATVVEEYKADQNVIEEFSSSEIPSDIEQSNVNFEPVPTENAVEEPVFEQPVQEQTIPDYEPVPDVVELTDEEIAKEADKIFAGPTSTDVELSDEDLDFINELSDDFEIVEDENAYEEIPEDIEIVEEDQIVKEIQNDIENLPEKEEDFNVEILEDEEDDTLDQNIRIDEKEEVVEDDEPLPTKSAISQAVPEFSAEISKEDMVESDPVQQGDIVTHLKHGRGVVEKMINYGNKTLCFINFDTPGVGKRLIDPTLELIKKA